MGSQTRSRAAQRTVLRRPNWRSSPICSRPTHGSTGRKAKFLAEMAQSSIHYSSANGYHVKSPHAQSCMQTLQKQYTDFPSNARCHRRDYSLICHGHNLKTSAARAHGDVGPCPIFGAWGFMIVRNSLKRKVLFVVAALFPRFVPRCTAGIGGRCADVQRVSGLNLSGRYQHTDLKFGPLCPTTTPSLPVSSEGR